MLNRFYEYNANPVGLRTLTKIEGDKGGISFDLAHVMAHSMNFLGNYIGYVKAHTIMDNDKGLQVPIDRNKRTPIWSIEKLAKHVAKKEGVSLNDENFLEKATELLEGRTFSVNDVIDEKGIRVQSFARGSGAKSSRPYTTKNVINPASENDYNKNGKETKNWEKTELSNERILLNAISKAFIKLKSSSLKSWDETIDIPLFKYLDDSGNPEAQAEIPDTKDLKKKDAALKDTENKEKDVYSPDEINNDFKRTSIQFTTEKATIKDLVFFFIATIGQKVNLAYKILIEDREHNDKYFTNVRTKLEGLGIKDIWDWTLTCIRIITDGPFVAAADLGIKGNHSDINKFHRGLFEYDKDGFTNFISLSKPKPFNLSQDEHDVGLFGLYASLLFPKYFKVRTQDFYLTFLGKFIDELVGKDFSIQTISMNNDEYDNDEYDDFYQSSNEDIVVKQNTALDSLDTAAYNAYAASTPSEELEKRMEIFEDTVLNLKYINRIEPYLPKDKFDGSKSVALDIILAYIKSKGNWNGAIVNSGHFYNLNKDNEGKPTNRNNSPKELENLTISWAKIKNTNAGIKIKEFIKKYGGDTGLDFINNCCSPVIIDGHKKGQANFKLGRLLRGKDKKTKETVEFVNDSNKNCFEALGLPFKECKKAFSDLMKDVFTINEGNLARINNILAELFNDKNVGKLSDTQVAQSFGLIISGNKENENSNTPKNKIFQYKDTLVNKINTVAQDKIGSENFIEVLRKGSKISNNGAYLIMQYLINKYNQKGYENSPQREILKNSNFSISELMHEAIYIESRREALLENIFKDVYRKSRI